MSTKNYFNENQTYTSMKTRDFEILGWCPAGAFLPHGEKVPL